MTTPTAFSDNGQIDPKSNPAFLLDRGWYEAFYPPLSRRNLTDEAARATDDGPSTNETIVKSDDLVIPFAIVIDADARLEKEHSAHQTLANSSKMSMDAGPVPFQYFARSESLKSWIDKNSDERRSATGPVVDVSFGENRKNHFARRAGDNLYSSDSRRHLFLVEDSVQGKNGQTVDFFFDEYTQNPTKAQGVACGTLKIWAVEVFLGRNFNFSHDGRIPAELVCHFEARLAQSSELKRNEVLKQLHTVVISSIRNLTREAGLSEKATRYNPATPCHPSTRKSEKSERKLSRKAFHKDLEERLNSLHLQFGDELLKLELDTKVSSTCKGSGDSTDISLDRRDYTISVFPIFERAWPSSSSENDSTAIPETSTEISRLEAKNRIMTSLITGTLSTRESSMKRANENQKDISEHIHRLVMRDGVGYVFMKENDAYNASALAYTFGIRLDQFLLGRMTSQLLERISYTVSNYFDVIEFDQEKRNKDRKNGGKKGKELEALRRHMRELQNIDEDIVRLRAIYWHASTAGSERSNSLLQDYRDQHKDEAALELLETKCSDFHRIIRARREIHELTRADSSKNLILLITALAVPAAVMPTILAHESALSLPLGWYLIITVVVTALLAIAFYWLLRLKEHCALKKEAE